MNKIVEIFKQKWIGKTIMTILLIVILIVAFIGINIWVQSMNFTPIDVTKEKLYTLSDESKNQIKNITQKVDMYFFGYEDDNVYVQLAKQYNSINENINVETVKITERPDLAEKYGIDSDEAYGIVVQSPDRYKVLTESDFVTYDSNTYETIDISEQKMTNAILDTTMADKPKVYFLTGHEEYQLDTEMTTLGVYLANEVNEINTLDLLSSEMPEDIDCLVIPSPNTDFSDVEVQKITDYINNGGNILWLNDAKVTDTDLPNVQKILDLYGVKIEKGIVLEQDSSKMILENPEFVKPDINYHEITKDIYNASGILMIDTGKIQIAESEKLEELNVTSNVLLQTSETSFLRTDFNNNSLTKSDSDTEGSVTVGVEMQKKINDEKTSKLVLYANGIFATDILIPISTQSQKIAVTFYNNKDLILNTVAYLTNREDAIRIRKDIGTVTYTPTEQEDTIVRVIIFTVPFIIVIIGIVVWQIRRRKK